MPRVVRWERPQGKRWLISFKQKDPTAQAELTRHSCVRRMWKARDVVYVDVEFFLPQDYWEAWLEEVKQAVGEHISDMTLTKVDEVWERSR